MGLEFRKSNTEREELRVSEIWSRKLLTYADGFCELAKSYDTECCETWGEDKAEYLTDYRLWENRQMVRSQLEKAGNLLKQVAGEVLKYRPVESRKSKLLHRELAAEGIGVSDPCYITGEEGRERLAMILKVEKGGAVPAEEVVNMISVLLNRRMVLSANSPMLVERTPHTFCLEEEPRYVMLTGFARAAREGAVTSGDSTLVTYPERGKAVVLLSDGTGSGEQAGRDSERVLELMDKFLEADCTPETAASLVNNAFFLMGEDDKHPTLDMGEIDLYNGEVNVTKIGGAVSFLKRDREVKVLQRESLPLGAVGEIEACSIRDTMQEGDFLVMISDGVADAFTEMDYERGLCACLGEMREQNPGELAKQLLRMAIIAGGGHVRDDMTVAVAGIWCACS